VPAASAAASQVWPMNSTATMSSALTMAVPAAFRPPVASSASVEIPSKPRKLSTAMLSAGDQRRGHLVRIP